MPDGTAEQLALSKRIQISDVIYLYVKGSGNVSEYSFPRGHAKSDYMTEILKYHTEKGCGNMGEITGANTNESKRHYIADEELGGIEREYTETDRKADVGDFVKPSFGPSPYFGGLSLYSVVDVDADDVGDIAVYDDGDNFHVLTPGYFSTYEKTDIIRHNGERYRLVDRKAEVGDKVISLKGDGSIGLLAGNIYTVAKSHKVVSGHLVEVIDDQTDLHGLTEKGYRIIEPVIGEKETDAPSESQPDLIDLVIRLTRKVAELEKEISAMGDVFERRDSWFEHRLSVVKKTADNADYKAGQALTSTSQFAEKLTDSEISVKLDGRTVARVITGSADE